MIGNVFTQYGFLAGRKKTDEGHWAGPYMSYGFLVQDQTDFSDFPSHLTSACNSKTRSSAIHYPKCCHFLPYSPNSRSLSTQLTQLVPWEESGVPNKQSYAGTQEAEKSQDVGLKDRDIQHNWHPPNPPVTYWQPLSTDIWKIDTFENNFPCYYSK